MTLREVAKNLREAGHSVSYVVRNDGSIRITRVDGVKFSARGVANPVIGLSGNAYAKSLFDAQFHIDRSEESIKSEERAIEQRRKNLANIKTFKGNRSKFLKYQPIEFQRKFKAIQREIRKSPYGKGIRVTWEATRTSFERYGAEEVIERLKNQIDMAKGRAPQNFVDALKNDLSKIRKKHKEFNEAYDYVLANESNLPAYGVNQALGILYDMDKGIISAEQASGAVLYALKMKIEDWKNLRK